MNVVKRKIVEDLFDQLGLLSSSGKTIVVEIVLDGHVVNHNEFKTYSREDFDTIKFIGSNSWIKINKLVKCDLVTTRDRITITIKAKQIGVEKKDANTKTV